MQLIVVLVEPEYEQNIGYCARVMKNFDFSDLVIVNPKKISEEARMYSKHAYDILSSAKIVEKVEDALTGCSFVIGTTAIKSTGKEVLRVAITPREAAEKFATIKGKIALLIGREGTGLSKEELELCDAVITIPSSENYRTLNISHALGIILYEFKLALSSAKSKEVETISENEKRLIEETTKNIVKSLKGIRGEKTTILSLKRIFARGIRSSIEGRALINFLKKIEKKLLSEKSK